MSDPIEFQSIDAVDPSQLIQYDWPCSLDEQIWRHITDASLIDSDENYRAMLFTPSSKTSKTFFLRGWLVPSPNSPFGTESIYLIKIPVSNYSIDVDKETRGLWMQSDSTYYKIDTLSSDYSRSFGFILDTVLKFLQLHDNLIDCAKTTDSKGLYKLDNTILSIRKKFGVKIDLEFILNNKQTIEDNLIAFISKPKSPKLYSTIKSLTANQVQRSKLNESKPDGSSVGDEEDEDDEVIAVKLKRKRASSGKMQEETEDNNSLDTSTHDLSINSSSISDRKKVSRTSPSQPETLTAVPTTSTFLDSVPSLDDDSTASIRIIEKATKLDVLNAMPRSTPSHGDLNQRKFNDTVKQNRTTTTNKEKRSYQSNSHSDASNTHYRNNSSSNNNSNATSTHSTAQLERLVISKPISKKSSVLDAISSTEPVVDLHRVNTHTNTNTTLPNKVARTTSSSDQFSSSMKPTGLSGSSSLDQRSAIPPSTSTAKNIPASVSLRKDDTKAFNHVSTADAGYAPTTERNRTVSSKDATHGIALPHFTINRKPEIVTSVDTRTYGGRSEDSDLSREYRRERDQPKKILTDSRPPLTDKVQSPRSSSANPLHVSSSGLGRGREAVRPAWMDQDKRRKEDVPSLSRPKYSTSATGISSPKSRNSNQSSSSSIGRKANAELLHDKSKENYSAPSQTTNSDDSNRNSYTTSSSSNDLKRKRDALTESEGPLRPSSEQSGSMHTTTTADPRIALRDKRLVPMDTAESVRSSSTTQHIVTQTKVDETVKVSSILRQPRVLCCPFCKSEKLGCKCRDSRRVWLPLPQSRWRTNATAGDNERWHVSPFLSTSNAQINVFDDLIPSITLIELDTPESGAISRSGTSSNSNSSSSSNGSTVRKRSKYGEGIFQPMNKNEEELVGPEFDEARANSNANIKITLEEKTTMMDTPKPKTKSLSWRDINFPDLSIAD